MCSKSSSATLSMSLSIRKTGVLLRAVPDADGDRDHGDMLPQELPQAVKDFIGRKYPGRPHRRCGA